ncbi:hypothetical protein DPMN_163581 [Dreissena polymorpha]|uniref:Uncharacterized protein n=1 Tax=Dreissena polymorpha TaxID=45954 RepID=A0A9D4EWX6_DREPO|nr:hypothetical protein DPMN_163581 [Dreissena polymorpha]
MCLATVLVTNVHLVGLLVTVVLPANRDHTDKTATWTVTVTSVITSMDPAQCLLNVTMGTEWITVSANVKIHCFHFSLSLFHAYLHIPNYARTHKTEHMQ